MEGPEIKTESIAKTENFSAWKAYEPDEETYHIEFGKVTVHFFEEEWEEFLEFKAMFQDIPLGTTGNLAETENYFASCEEVDKENLYTLEMPGVSLYFFEEDWQEICDLLKSIK